MIQKIISILLLFNSTGLIGQIQLVPITYSNHKISASNNAAEDKTLSLPFWDDFSKGNAQIDTNLWKIGKDVFINNTIGTNAPSIFVATFDGTNEFGRPYGSTEFIGLGDVLQSHPINLALVPVNRRNTVFLSFYYQLKGNGNLPNELDSLQLQFFTFDSVWVAQNINPSNPERMALTGGFSKLIKDANGIPVFKQIIIAISNPIYFHPKFAFRFRSFSNINGIYDTWNLDYIYINQDRTIRDTTHFDRSISGPQFGLLEPFQSMPVHQYALNPDRYSKTVFTYVSNLDNTFHPLTYSHILNNINTGTNEILSSVVDFRLDPYERSRIISGLNLSDIEVNSEFDTTSIASTFIYHTGDKNLFEVVGSQGDTIFLPVNLKQNDTLNRIWHFSNYYAFDDGTAEFAAAINLIGGKMIVAFPLEESDTLTDIAIHFPSIQPATEGQTIDLLVMSGLDNLLELRRQPYTIQATDRDQFQIIQLAAPIIVRDTFYIGFEQFTNNYIGVGFDRNSSGGSNFIYTNTNRQWDQNTRLSGSLMIRPIFRSAQNYILTIPKSQNSFVSYPNPASDIIKFDGHFDQLIIQDLSGNTVLNTAFQSNLDVTFLNNGLYIFKFLIGNNYTTQTIIISHDF